MQSLRRAIVVAAFIGIATAAHGLEGEPMLIIDFASESSAWPSIDDVVMGGVSSSDMSIADGFATFRGEVSFDNNGGFASVRSRAQIRDLSMFDGLTLQVRGDGKTYGFRIRTTSSFDGVSYQVAISPPAGEWHEVRVAFTDFVPVYRGRKVSSHPPLDPSRVTTLGLIISRQEGPFRLDIASIAGYRLDDEGRSAEASK
jgi:monofunctional biosynthetic peptidoglycan transglycosylase